MVVWGRDVCRLISLVRLLCLAQVLSFDFISLGVLAA